MPPSTGFLIGQVIVDLLMLLDQKQSQGRNREVEAGGELEQEKWLIPDIYVEGKAETVTSLEIAAITLESQKRPTDQKINSPVDSIDQY